MPLDNHKLINDRITIVVGVLIDTDMFNKLKNENTNKSGNGTGTDGTSLLKLLNTLG